MLAKLARTARRARTIRLASVAGAIALTLTLSACETGMHPATLDDAPLDARSANAGPIAIRGAIVVAPTEGSGAMFVATLLNLGTTQDSLTGVTISTPDFDFAATLKPDSIALPVNVLTKVPDGARPEAVVDGTVTIGTYVKAHLSFAKAGSVTMTLLVVADTGIYSGYVASAE